MSITRHPCPGPLHLGLILALLSPLPCLAQAAGKPAAVAAHRATIKSDGGGPYFRLILPATIYRTAANVTLDDVRVRNAHGDLVPHAWLDEPTTETRVFTDRVAFYPVAASGNERPGVRPDVSLQFKQNRDGSLIIVRTGKPLPNTSASDWIIDASQVNGTLLQARLTVDDGAVGLYPLTLEGSDDLRHWRAIEPDGQVVILKDPSATIEKLAVDLHGARAKFLRLRWQDPARTVAIKSVTIDSVERDTVVAPLQWLPSIAPLNCTATHCDYEMPARTPLDSVRINLDEPNTLATVTVSAQRPENDTAKHRSRPHPLYVLRHKRQPPAMASVDLSEIIAGQTVVYRIRQDGKDLRSEDIVLDGGIYARLRLRVVGSISELGQKTPILDVASTPRTLVFLGRGPAPYTLHWGVNDVGRAVPLATLIPGHRANAPVQATTASVEIANTPLETAAERAVTPTPDSQPASQPISPPVSQPTSQAATDAGLATRETNRLWLWSALAFGLLVLAGMAWSLLKSMDKAKER